MTEENMETHEIMAILHQAPPFLMIDKVVEAELPTRIVTIKTISANDPYLVGHFPDRPIMPGVLIIESIAQSAALLFHMVQVQRNNAENEIIGKDIYYVIGMIKKMRFAKITLPGDCLRIEVCIGKMIGDGRSCVDAKVSSSGKRVAAGSIYFSKVEL